MLQSVRAAVAVIASLLAAFAVHAQVYPAKPVRLIVPYPAGGGQIPLMFLDLAAGAPQIKSGKLKALAVASDKRIAALPDLPTVAESGIPGFEAWAWQALAAPIGTPREIVARLNAEFRKAVSVPELRQKLIDAGIDPLQSSPEDASAYIRSEALKWSKVISDGRITVE